MPVVQGNDLRGLGARSRSASQP